MSKIRKSAQGESCALRIPGHCNFNPETTVLAHIGRRRGISKKCHDMHAVYACSACHDVIDGRANHEFTKGDLAIFKLDAMEETQLKLIDKGLINA